MTLALVRHGQSEGNAAGIIQGWVDAALTDQGRREAAAVAQRFAGEPVAAVYASTLARAFDTATAIASRHALAVEPFEDLREHHFGEAEGMRWADAVERFGLANQNWRQSNTLIPGIEPVEDFHHRVVARLERLIEAHDGDLAVAVAHGGVIGQFTAHLLGLGPAAVPRLTVGNCSVTLLERVGGATLMRTFNDRCHLEVRA